MKDFFSPLIENAIRLANYWHRGQKRRESEFDYFTHLTAVAMILTRADFSEDVVSAGFCHHLLSNSDCPSDEIVSVLGRKVYQIIEVLNEKEEAESEEVWKVEKERFIEKVKNASEDVKAVCVADRIANIQVLMEVLDDKGMRYFDSFVVGPEELLWYEDNLCMMLEEVWKHPLLDEYDRLIDEFVNFLERLDEGEDLSGLEQENENSNSSIKKKIILNNFDIPVEEKKENVLKRVEKKEPAPLPSINKVSERRKKRRSLVVEDANKGLYLTDEEYNFVLPAVLQLGITQENITNQMIQERLKINYLTAFRVLKELKRLHIINRADGLKPRKVDISRAGKLLRELTE